MPGLIVERNRFAIDFAPDLKRAIENHNHELDGLADAHVNVAGFEMNFQGLAEEPCDLIVGQIGEHRNAQLVLIYRSFDSYTLLKY